MRRRKDREQHGRGRIKESGEKEKLSRNKLLHAFYVSLVFYKDNAVRNKW